MSGLLMFCLVILEACISCTPNRKGSKVRIDVLHPKRSLVHFVGPMSPFYRCCVLENGKPIVMKR
ncbi:hypothetical protein BofuT4_P093700.1 [Botrytis cinerea T4]|uniref:Secreted protein n=1 Tax=Botryotinia fuckeliana (strain T4) TaxID=999810 RepID=G2YD14_BOTF4|nr:hypothetical protein BofuT4_P093700.1 [Botrytis cinerea T4]